MHAAACIVRYELFQASLADQGLAAARVTKSISWRPSSDSPFQNSYHKCNLVGRCHDCCAMCGASASDRNVAKPVTVPVAVAAQGLER